MNKTLLVIATTAMCVGAFAQGKIIIWNDQNHLVYDIHDRSPITGPQWVVQLYGYPGTGAGSLVLLTSVSMTPSVPGLFGPVLWISPFPGGSPSTFQVRIRDDEGLFFGQSSVFTMQPGGSIAYNSLFNPGGTTLSTWANGTVPVVGGGFGAIGVGLPEPSSLALSGLGLASLWVCSVRFCPSRTETVRVHLQIPRAQDSQAT